MKKFAKILTLVLVLALVLSLTACGGKETIVGSWKYAFEMEKIMEVAGASDDMPDSFKGAFKGISFNMVMDLKEDGTYELSIDEDSVKSAVESLKAAMRPAMQEYMEQEAKDHNMSLDDFLSAAGMTMDQAIDSFMEEFDAEEMLSSVGEVTEKGKYTFESGKLTLTNEKNEQSVLTAELKGSELSISGIEGESEMDESLKQMLPLVFKK